MPVKKDLTDPRQAKPTPRTSKPRPEKPDDNRGDQATAAQKAYKATLDAQHRIRIENMAHALIYDICQLRDVVTRLFEMEAINAGVISQFLEYYVPRLEVLLEEDAINGSVRTLSDLGEWRLIDDERGLEFPFFQTIASMLTKKLDLTPVQLSLLLQRSAIIEREEPSRGESWIPKQQSRRASAS